MQVKPCWLASSPHSGEQLNHNTVDTKAQQCYPYPTPLNVAVPQGRRDVCGLLEARAPGAARLRDKHGRTPREREEGAALQE